jgi:hypothetical protein
MHSKPTRQCAVPLAVSLGFVLSGPAWAQPAPSAEPLRLAPERSSTGRRVGTELGMGVVTSLGLGLAGGLAAGLVGMAVCPKRGPSSEPFAGACPMTAAALTGVVGAGVGLPLGVWWGGKMTGGNGWLLGAAGGLAASLALSGTAFALEQELLGAGLLLAMPVFTVVGYELTDSEPRHEPPVAVSPSLRLGPGGTSFGLQGRF